MSEVQKVVLLPRYTSFAGSGEFLSAPVNVREFASADVSVWRGAHTGSMVTDGFVVRLEASPDITNWDPVGAQFVPQAGVEVTYDFDFTMDWIRLRTTLTGTNPTNPPALTCWAVGNFLRREK